MNQKSQYILLLLQSKKIADALCGNLNWTQQVLKLNSQQAGNSAKDIELGMLQASGNQEQSKTEHQQQSLILRENQHTSITSATKEHTLGAF